MKITAAVAHEPQRPFELIDCDLSDDLAAGEVLVRIKACGICHTDLAVKLQHIPVPLPKVLGHEGAGVIERVGPGVAGLAEGDHVLMSFGSCGACGQCQVGAPGYCDEFSMINLFGQRRGGSGLRCRGAELGGYFFAQSASRRMLLQLRETSSKSTGTYLSICLRHWVAEFRRARARC